MNAIERDISRAGLKWRIRLFLERFGIAASITVFLMLVVGGAADLGILKSMTLATTLLGISTLCFLITVLILFVQSLSWVADRRLLAGLVEKGHPNLADRVNTLVFLEKFHLVRYSTYFWYHRRIAQQAEVELQKHEGKTSVSWKHVFINNGIFVGLLILTVLFYNMRDPWQKLEQKSQEDSVAAAEKPVDLALPTTNALEEKKEWGEIRITDPARDMKITKVDVVPLQIEAAASRPLIASSWFTSVNGDVEQPHALPQGKEPRYAVYQPTIYADEYGLRDWDVMTYYAQSRVSQSNSYGSEVYFLEVRPFREDILKMAGGEGGKAYQVLSQISSLIDRQQQIIRQTHHTIQSPAATEKMQQQDNEKLAGAEMDLSHTVGHLYAEIAVKMENKPIGAALDQLGKSEKTLMHASELLAKNSVSSGLLLERQALRELIDTRKLFQKSVSEHPDDFKDKPGDEADTPIVADARDQLAEMAEFRNEEKATRDFLDQLLKKQTTLTVDTVREGNRAQTNNAAKQMALQQELKQFSGLHPQIFTNATNELSQALDSMDKSATSLKARVRELRKAPEVADQKMHDLVDAVQMGIAGRQLSGAYRLKKMLDQQLNELKKIEQKPTNATQKDLEKTSSKTKETTRQMKEMTEQKPVSDLFGPELGSAMSRDKKQALDQALDQLSRAQTAEDRKKLASEAADNLNQISKAFEQSQPQAMKEAHKRDALKEQNGFERGMDELRSMMARMQGERPATDEELRQMAREAQLNIMEDLQNHPDETTKKLLMMLDEEIKETGHKIDLAALKKMMSELENISTEVKDIASKTNETGVTAMDASKAPPAYRGRIQTYFKKLSENK